MAQGDRATIGVVDIATPNVTIGGLTDLPFPPGVQEVVEGSAGVDAEYLAIMAAMGRVAFTTRDLTALASIGLNGVAVTTLDAYYQMLAGVSGREAYGSAKHLKVSMSSGLAVPRMLSCGVGETAQCSFEAFAISADGATNPITVTADQTMPDDGSVDDVWTIGPIELNTVDYDVGSVSIDFGLDVAQEPPTEGDTYPKLCLIANRRPRITLTTLSAEAMATITSAGLALTSFAVYFRKLAARGTRVAEVTAEHVKISGTTGMAIPGDSSASIGGGRLATPITIVPDTSPPLTISTASAIT